MKSLLTFSILFMMCLDASSQTTYYKGEWTDSGSTAQYDIIFKLDISGHTASGEILWIYNRCDSAYKELVVYMKNKKGLMAIEYVKGNFNPQTNDLTLAGHAKKDPNEVIGMDTYTLKLSLDKQTIYGKTENRPKFNGLIFAARMPDEGTEAYYSDLESRIIRQKL